mmetsp:Transcript_19046/g.54882  ORF Transcript_19046/g.54882 Transcript_19046/m.54882 type:complete len:388 (+) Transcript_19046:220-1383(+)
MMRSRAFEIVSYGFVLAAAGMFLPQPTAAEGRWWMGRSTKASVAGNSGKTFVSWPSFLPSLDVPTLFPSANETKYDRYAACLAATEGIRRARDVVASSSNAAVAAARQGGTSAVSERADVANEVMSDSRNSIFARIGRPLTSALGGGKAKQASIHSSSSSASASKPVDEETFRRVSVSYVLQAAKVVRGLGLTIPQFNQLGREVGSNPALKEKVMEQAYLYRLAAALSMDKVHVHDDPVAQKLLRAHRRKRIQMFARSMTDIEELRKEQQEKLKQALNLDRLPEGISICDPSIQPLLSPKVRAVCSAFPLQAEEIIDKYGLNSEEFNSMLSESKNNPLFKFQVLRYVKRGRNGGEAVVPVGPQLQEDEPTKEVTKKKVTKKRKSGKK